MKKSRIKDIAVVVFIVCTISGVSHFVITNPLGPSRLLYYAQMPIIKRSTQCTDGAPEWMWEVQSRGVGSMGAPASQLAFISPDSTLHHCETGWLEGGLSGEPLPVSARFRYASVTKSITAIAIIDLVNSGQLSLDDKVIRVLGLGGEPKDQRVGEITIKHLLSHRGGWDRVHTQDAMFMMNLKPWCPYEAEKLLGSSLMFNPGENTSYSNLGYCLLGLVIEHVSGKSFREYVQSLPGFSGSSLLFVDGPYLSDEVSYDFRHENFYMEDYYNHYDFYALSSSSGLSGNAVDLARVIRLSLDRGPLKIISGDVFDGCDPTEIQKCFGFGVYRFQPELSLEPVFMHDGKLPGVASLIAVTRKGGVLVWLGAGTPRPGSLAPKEFHRYIYEVLSEGDAPISDQRDKVYLR